MGRSSSLACLNIVACGKKSPDDDEIDAPVEGRTQSDKRRWSFRKRSATHRVLSNVVPPELPPSSIVKESSESNAHDYSEQTNPPILEKLSVIRKADDVFPLSPVALSSKDADSLACNENVSSIESSVLESAAIVIQASVTGYLAQRELAKLKNVIKLQAAVRGHLVRRQAVGTIRCVQAIVKMQALVRARRVRSSEEGLAIQRKLAEMCKSASRRADNLGKEKPAGKPNNLCTTDTLFRNGYARRLLESTDKTKPIYVACDPTKPSSGWSWLERWMSLSAKEHPCLRAAQLLLENQKSDETINLVNNEVEVSDKCLRTHVFDSSSIRDEKPGEDVTDSSGTQLEGDDDLITIDANGFNFHSCRAVEISNEGTKTNVCQEPPEVVSEGPNFTSSLRNALQFTLDHLSNRSDSLDYAVSASTASVSKDDSGSTNDSLNGRVSKEQEIEVKKSVSVPRKFCNPAFAAVQSKFEELSSPLASGRISASSNHCGGSSLGSVSPPKSDERLMHVNRAHDTDSCSKRFQKGTSECGTEISISSTLDSLDRFEPEKGELGHEVGNIDNEDGAENGTSENDPQPISDVLSASNAVASLPSAPEDSLRGSTDSAIAMTNMDSSKHMEPELKIELEARADKQVDNSSHEGSPTSATIPESHGTPSSQVSSGAQRRKADSRKSSRKRMASSTSKGSPSSQNHDSESTMEHLPKESKSGRRRNSFGSSKSDHTDREKSGTIPSYMQATESARAKALTSHSPKSISDVHDKDGYLKKRHSLPGSNGKQQNSPRMQRSLSQAQPAAKGNSGHSPQEREWKR